MLGQKARSLPAAAALSLPAAVQSLLDMASGCGLPTLFLELVVCIGQPLGELIPRHVLFVIVLIIPTGHTK
jgi:hypothetical protein